MALSEDVDYGPLTGLIGVWKGNKGMDVAPEPDGAENNPFYETITFTPAGDVTNAETQQLAAVHYRQVVTKISNDEVFHDETGYWIWDAQAGLLMQSFTITRAVGVLAGGAYPAQSGGDRVVLEVLASHADKDWQIIQSPFMRDHARTLAFRHQIVLKGDELHYSETTTLEIYDRVFEHTDNNILQRER